MAFQKNKPHLPLSGTSSNQRGVRNMDHGPVASRTCGTVAVLSHIATEKEIAQSVLGHIKANGSQRPRRTRAESVDRPSKFKSDGFHAAQRTDMRSFDWLPHIAINNRILPKMDPSHLCSQMEYRPSNYHSSFHFLT